MTNVATGVRIVEARREHAPFIAWVLLTAARSHLPKGLWDFVAGDDEARTLRFLEALTTTEQEHWAHHSIFLVAEVDGVPASALSGYLDAEHGTHTLMPAIQIALKAAGISEQEFAAGMAKGGTIANCAPSHVDGAWIVEHVATHPDYRRRGLIDALMAAVLERGRARGATVADIGVLIGNDNAQRAYEKNGFVVEAELLDAAFEAAYGCPGVRALSRGI
jgi:ribosomal protein S18 acetylase RimI-like enzyme